MKLLSNARTHTNLHWTLLESAPLDEPFLLRVTSWIVTGFFIYYTCIPIPLQGRVFQNKNIIQL